MSTMVKTRSSARVVSGAQNAPAENGSSSELRSRLKTTENGHRPYKGTSSRTSQPVSSGGSSGGSQGKDPLAPALPGSRNMYQHPAVSGYNPQDTRAQAMPVTARQTQMYPNSMYHGYGAGAAAATLAPMPAPSPSAPLQPFPVYPDVKFKKLAFYDVLAELLKPSTMMPMQAGRMQEGSYVFHLTPQQATEIASGKDIVGAGNKLDYVVQAQLRFCLLETSCEQEDYFPPSVNVKINNKLCPLPNPIPTNKPTPEPKRPPRPVNISSLVKLSPTVANTIHVTWASDFTRAYVLSVFMVKKLTSAELLQRLKNKGTKNPDYTRSLIKEKLSEDYDSEIATTSLRVSLMCPLGKMRMSCPCRPANCPHLQCFDASLFLQMNERKPTWLCPVCDRPAPYDSLVVDGYFQEVLTSPRLSADCNEIQLHADGNWSAHTPPPRAPQVVAPNPEPVTLISDDLENTPSTRPQSPEDVQNPTLVPGFQVSVTSEGSINLQPDAVLLQQCSRGLVPWRPIRSPVMASPTPGPSSSSPSLKRRRSRLSLDFGRSRRPLTTAQTKAVIADSGSDIEENEGDDAMDDFMADVGEAVEGETYNVESMRQIVNNLRSDIIQVEEAEEEVQGNLGGGDGNSSQFSWSEDFSTFSGQKTEFRGSPGPTQISLDPVDIFEYFWGGDIINTIVKETNRYARQMLEIAAERRVPPKNLMQWTETDAPEIYRLLAIIMLMTFSYRAKVKDYWTRGLLEMFKFRKLMSRDRFMLLIRFLHFVDNDTMPNYELTYDKKIAKIAPIVKHCNNKFYELYKPNEFLSLDESLLLWKGRLSWVQCIRSKAARFGIKSFELCEAGTGYQLKFILYAGNDSSFVQGPIHGFENPTAKVVLELMNEFLDLGHTLVMDNWYNQLALTRFLKSRDTDVIGTMNRNRKNVPLDIKIIKEKSLQRGAELFRHCGDISLVCWKDVKLVTAISTYHRDDMVPSRRAGVNILKPCVIKDYNSYMGGVDLKDQKLSMFLMERKRGSKWYHKVFRRLLNTSILNAFLIYRRNPTFKVMTHREFRVKLAEGLLDKYQASAPSVRTLTEREVRLDQQSNHFPIQVPADQHKRVTFIRNRCVRCAAAKRRKETTVKCSKCNAFLCLGDCWKDYHTLRNLERSSSS